MIVEGSEAYLVILVIAFIVALVILIDTIITQHKIRDNTAETNRLLGIYFKSNGMGEQELRRMAETETEIASEAKFEIVKSEPPSKSAKVLLIVLGSIMALFLILAIVSMVTGGGR